MYLLLMSSMEEAGYRQYEISNFAKPGMESRHNITYWRNQDYYGLGAGAHGYARRMRHMNVKGVSPYIEATKTGLPRLNAYPVSKEEAMEDFMMVGLRMREGISDKAFREQFDRQLEDVFGKPLQKMLSAGLLEREGGNYRLSRQGILFGNDVFGEFVGALTEG